MALLRGLNFWTIKQRIKDQIISKTSTIKLLYRFDVYGGLSSSDLRWMQMLDNGCHNAQKNPNIRFITDKFRGVRFLTSHSALKRTTGEMPSHSFVLQFSQHLEAMMAHAMGGACDPVTVKDTGGNNRTVQQTSTNANVWMSAEAPAGNTSYGILVGLGTTAPANDNYAMENQNTTLTHNATSVGAAGVVGSNVDLVIVRPFVNGTGGSITIREVGLVLQTETAGWYFLCAHDAVNQAIANTEVAIVSYVVRTTV